jgi:general secretion pathway protein A
MYEAHFGFRLRPFSLHPDARFLYLGEHHRRVLTLLRYALRYGDGFAVVTGEIGSGKTTLVQQAMAESGEDMNVGLLSNTHAGLGALLPWVAQAFGAPSSNGSLAHFYDQLVSLLVREHALGRRSVLIVDEAQNLSAAQLEELRVLSNMNTGSRNLMQTVLVGQPELKATLRSPALRQLTQRVVVEHHLGVLGSLETDAYIRHRLRVAGGSQRLFDDAAIALVHRCTGGVPRLINQICDMALVYGFSDQRKTVDAGLVETVVQERSRGSLLPLLAGNPESIATAVLQQ